MGAGVRFNLFQRMMLRWRELHPYNPVHVVRVPDRLDPDRLRDTIAARLGSLGLTGLSVDEQRWRFNCGGGLPSVDLAVVAAGSDPQATLSRLIEGEFNRPFPTAQPAQPFRFSWSSTRANHFSFYWSMTTTSRAASQLPAC